MALESRDLKAIKGIVAESEDKVKSTFAESESRVNENIEVLRNEMKDGFRRMSTALEDQKQLLDNTEQVENLKRRVIELENIIEDRNPSPVSH